MRGKRIASRLAVLVGIFMLMAFNGAIAKEFGGISFPDEAIVGEKPCRLVGVGVRKKFFIDVYYGALYLQQPSAEARQVIESDQPKRVLLHVVYKQVDPDKWVEGWKEGFSKNVSQPDEALKQKIDQFIKCFSEPVKKGEEVEISYVPGTGTSVVIKGQKKATLPGREFMTALWSIWFGKEPASESLMNGMLGK